MTAGSGVGDGGFAVSAAWLDYDRDGLVDLFVGNYVDWSPETDTGCGNPPGVLRSRRVPSGRAHPVPQRRPGSLRGRHRAGRPRRPDRQGDGGSRCSTTTPTAGPTCSSAATACPQSCTTTTERGDSSTWGLRAGVSLSERGRARANMGGGRGRLRPVGPPRTFSSATSCTRCSASIATRATASTWTPRPAPRWAAPATSRSPGRSSSWTSTSTADSTSSPRTAAPTSRRGCWIRERGSASRRCCSETGATARFRTPAAERARRSAGRPWGGGAAYADFDGDGDLDLVLTALNGPRAVAPQRRRQPEQLAAGPTGRHAFEPARDRGGGAGGERVGQTVTNGAQRVELCLPERAVVDVRPRGGPCGGNAGGGVAVGGDAAFRGRRPQPADRHRRGGRPPPISVRAVTLVAALPR